MRKQLRHHAEACETILKQHDDQWGWDHLRPEVLLARARDNVISAELYLSKKNYKLAEKESLDASNLLMMFWDNLTPKRNPE